ncbi:exopolyphosphatase PRUNE1 [Chelonus insularis]|uniref:exopolyphosphatase PRUNE1 n=1 Tax=Chelonus insularis TaxID=460826 RepID=UPI00158AEA49|nr:exopolyphosphatase PRUNE1 [Chelonus insularis]
MKMEEFLRESKSALNKLDEFTKVKVILGNETCDLDSAVCSLTHGLWHYDNLKNKNIQDVAVIPVLNIKKNELKLKTEVVYLFNEHQVPLELLTFRNEIDLSDLNKRQMLELSLVDHHTLSDYDTSLADAVLEVIDHRPQDPNWMWTGRDVNLEKVGSCATLIARNILEKNPKLLDFHISSLLRGPILIDTCNFSESAARATPLDIKVTRELEKIIDTCSSTKQDSKDEIYSRILSAKTDIGCLSSEDLLLKDLKFVNGIPIPGLPILVKEFLNLNGALEAVNAFTRERECCLTILLGMDLKENVAKRDLAVFSFLPNDLENKITKALEESSVAKLSLLESTSKENWSLKLYKQENVRATRKQILPIIQSASAGIQC